MAKLDRIKKKDLIEGRYSRTQKMGERFWELLEGHRNELIMMGPRPSYIFLASRFIDRNPQTKALLNKVQDEMGERATKIPMSDAETNISWAVMSASTGYTLRQYNNDMGTRLSKRRLETPLN